MLTQSPRKKRRDSNKRASTEPGRFDKAEWRRDVSAFRECLRAVRGACLRRDLTLRRGRARLGLLRAGDPGRTGATPRERPAHAHNRASPRGRPRLLRPPLSRTGHAAQGRLRQPHRAAPAVPAAPRRQERVRGRRPSAGRRPVAVALQRDAAIALRGRGAPSRARSREAMPSESASPSPMSMKRDAVDPAAVQAPLTPHRGAFPEYGQRWYRATSSTSPRTGSRKACRTGSSASPPSKTRSSIAPRRCACRPMRSRASSAAQRRSAASSPCRGAAYEMCSRC